MRASSDPTPIRTPLSPPDPDPDPDPDPLHLTETHTYEAPYQIHALNWTIRPDKPYRLAIASLLEQQTNHIDILQFNPNSNSIQPDPNLSFAHPYPPTKTMFIPDSNSSKPDLLATSSDFLRIWEIQNDAVTLKSCLDGHRKSKFFGPVTSFDWNDMELSRVGTASVDTTCTIWDVELGVVDTQLIAHDKEVYDIAWGDGVGVFASVSGDGSVRLFDLRNKEHSLIIYQNDGPLIKLGWHKGNPVYMSAVVMDSNKVVVLDVRYPSIPLAELGMHRSNVNAVSWGLHSGSHICSGGDDGQALFWNLSMRREVGVEPVLAYVAEAEIEQLQWSLSQPNWLALAFSNKLQLLKFEDC